MRSAEPTTPSCEREERAADEEGEEYEEKYGEDYADDADEPEEEGGRRFLCP